MRRFTLALTLLCPAFAAAAEPAPSMSWRCAADADALRCETSVEYRIELPRLDDEPDGGVPIDGPAEDGGTETGFRGTETGFRGTETGFRGTETGFRGTETGFRGTETGFRGTETGFRPYLLVGWTCEVKLDPRTPDAPAEARCDAPWFELISPEP